MEFWRDWMWEVPTWFGKMGSYDVYRLLHHRYIVGPFGAVHLCITPESTPLHPITDVLQGLTLEYIPGVSMVKPKQGIGSSKQEAEKISSDVMAGLRAVKAENCLLHNDTRNVVLRKGNRSPVIIDFGEASIRRPGANDDNWRTEVRIHVTCGGV